MTKILLAGATGMVGAVALDLLLSDDRVGQVVAPSRRPLRSPPNLRNPLIDSTGIPHDADWWAADGAICALGTTRAKSRSTAAYRAIDHDYALAIATQVRAAGTERFALVTSMGADARSWFLYTRTKGELEHAVDRLGFPSLPILPASARTSPASTVAALLAEAALTGSPGRHIVTSAQIARIAEGRT